MTPFLTKAKTKALLEKIKTKIPTKTSELTNDSNFTETYIVTASVPTAADGEWSVSDWEGIKAAYDTNKRVIMRYDDDEIGAIVSLREISFSGGIYFALFSILDCLDDSISQLDLKINLTNGVVIANTIAAGLNKNCADYVVEQGTSDIWTYRKWNSGIAECWADDSIVFGISEANTGIADGLKILYKDISLPFAFSANTLPSAVASSKWEFTEWVQAHPLDNQTVRIRLFGTYNSIKKAKAEGIQCSIHITGRWK